MVIDITIEGIRDQLYYRATRIIFYLLSFDIVFCFFSALLPRFHHLVVLSAQVFFSNIRKLSSMLKKLQ